MNKRFTEEQIIPILKGQEAGEWTSNVYRRLMSIDFKGEHGGYGGH